MSKDRYARAAFRERGKRLKLWINALSCANLRSSAVLMRQSLQHIFQSRRITQRNHFA
jgi:hypothetical protein